MTHSAGKELPTDLLPVETALERLLSGVAPLAIERLGLAKAGGRVLAEPVIAARSQPAFAASAMDGYALRSSDAQPGKRLLIVGESAAGRGFAQPVGPGEAVRIFTGAPVPAGADAVLVQEAAVVEGKALLVPESLPAGRFVRPAGMDFAAGQEVLRPGTRLGPRELALAAAANRATVIVHQTPRVAVLSIGDELLPPGETAGGEQTIASNGFAIAELARLSGAIVIDLGIAADEAAVVARIAREASANADVLVTIGGASVGDHDVTREGLKAAGMDLDFWRIAMRPGRPMAYGRLGSLRVLGLPGNPVSSYVCGLIFLRPLLAALQGLPAQDRSEPAVLGVDLPANDSRAAYLRARLEIRPDGLPHVHPLPDQDSSLVSVLVAADCLLVRPIRAPKAAAGTICRIIRLAV